MSSSRKELGRKANFAVKSGNYKKIKEYHAEIVKIEGEDPFGEKCMEPGDWHHFHKIWQSIATDEDLKGGERP